MLLDHSKGLHGSYSLCLTKINIYPSLVNKETQKLSSGNTKSTLEGVHTKLVKATSFKDSTQVRKMVFPCF